VKRILVTGAGGQLAQALLRHRWPEGYEPVALGRAELDIAETGQVATVLAGDWAAVVNTAAYTAVDRAEHDAVAAWRANALGPAALAAACDAAAIPLVHLSTDYVFDGGKQGAWEVDDPVGPLGVYAASKLGGELAVRTACRRHAIVRTAWMVSATGTNFVRTMLRLAAERDRVRVVADQRGSPTSADDLAAALAMIVVRLVEDVAAPVGTFHLAGSGATTWAGFAETIFAGSAARGGPSASVEPIATADYPTPARRPLNSLLATDAITRAYGIVPRPWQDALDTILDQLIGPRP
jgi:dTDP-4-dehydrorhamnose reductase